MKLAELRYDPFDHAQGRPWGEVRYAWGSQVTDYILRLLLRFAQDKAQDRLYTGQRSEVGSFGLMYYRARWYDPALGRFAQADSFIPNLSDAVAWDRFAYVRNNPLSYTDPSGHWYIEGWDDAYLQRQKGNTCAVVSTAVALSILYGRKFTQQEIQPAFPQTYRFPTIKMVVNSWDGNDIQIKYVDAVNYPGIGVPPWEQEWIIDALDPGLEADFIRGTRDDLMNNLNQGIPTIVSLALPGLDVGHAIVCVGYNPTTGEFLFFDPAYGDVVPESEILDRYYDERSFNTFDELWAASNIFIPGNSMVTVERIEVNPPRNGYLGVGGRGLLGSGLRDGWLQFY